MSEGTTAGLGCRLIPLLSCALLTTLVVTLTMEVIDIVEIQFAAKQLKVSIGVRPQQQQQIQPATRFKGQAVEEVRQHLECFSQSGRWVYNDTPRYIPPKVWGDALMGVCDKRWHNTTAGAVSGREANEVAAKGGDWKVREDLKWQWRTNQSCPTVPFDREGFCRTVGGRNILLVGDSITQETFYIFMDYAEGNATGTTVPLRNHRTVQLRHRVCDDVVDGGGFHVGYVRNDRLSLTVNYVNWLRDKTGWTEFPWIHLVREWNISLLLVNRGAHFESDGNYTEALTNTYHVLRSRYPDVQVFFRSTPEGHVNCSQATGPLPAQPTSEHLPYHWDEYRRQNRLAKEITESMGYTFLDLAAAVSLRPEAHLRPNDCLHYCLPGPLDVIIQMFYNVLLLLPKQEGLAQQSSSRVAEAS